MTETSDGNPLSIENLDAVIQAARGRVQKLGDSRLQEAYKDLCQAALTVVTFQKQDGLFKMLDDGMPTGDSRIDRAYGLDKE